jgi:hypothetical protein
MHSILYQAVQITGAVLILAAFTAAQVGWLGRKSLRYLLPNMIGSGMLAVLALTGRQWGFLLLEGAWAVISLGGVVSAVSRAMPYSTLQPAAG